MNATLYLVNLDKNFEGYAQAQVSKETQEVFYTNMSLREYLQERKISNYHLLEWDDFYEIYYNSYHKKLSSKPFIEISQEAYFEALECLPPMRWHNAISGVNIFFIEEAFTADLHDSYVCTNNGRVKKYYSALRSKFMTDAELLEQLKTQDII